MNDAVFEPDRVRKWLICEQGHRWFDAARRFIPFAMPASLVADFVLIPAGGTVLHQPAEKPAAVLWEIRPDTFLQTWDQMIQVARSRPQWIQLVADDGLQIHHRLALAESPVALIIDSPEQLPKIDPLIRGHFAVDA